MENVNPKWCMRTACFDVLEKHAFFQHQATKRFRQISPKKVWLQTVKRFSCLSSKRGPRHVNWETARGNGNGRGGQRTQQWISMGVLETKRCGRDKLGSKPTAPRCADMRTVMSLHFLTSIRQLHWHFFQQRLWDAFWNAFNSKVWWINTTQDPDSNSCAHVHFAIDAAT